MSPDPYYTQSVVFSDNEERALRCLLSRGAQETLGSVAKRAGITRMTLYRYMQNTAFKTEFQFRINTTLGVARGPVAKALIDAALRKGKGQAAMQRLYWKLIGDLVEKSEITGPNGQPIALTHAHTHTLLNGNVAMVPLDLLTTDQRATLLGWLESAAGRLELESSSEGKEGKGVINITPKLLSPTSTLLPTSAPLPLHEIVLANVSAQPIPSWAKSDVGTITADDYEDSTLDVPPPGTDLPTSDDDDDIDSDGDDVDDNSDDSDND